MIPISKPVFGKEEERAVADVLRSGRLAQGPKVREFEERFAEYVGAEHAVAVGNGTQALHAALRAHGVGQGDFVIVPVFTFAATATAVLMCGARPIFADSHPPSLGGLGAICPDGVETIWESRIPDLKVTVPVHLYGHPADRLFKGTGSDYASQFIWDACQAHGATLYGEPVGSWGTSCWSFYATKNLPIGEGGMVTTNDRHVLQRLQTLRSHGMFAPYDYRSLGYNYRMTEMQAAIGLCQLKKLPEMQERRTENAAYYSERLTPEMTPGIVPPKERPRCGHAWHQYTIRVLGEGRRDMLQAHLREQGIVSVVYYPSPLNRNILFGNYGYGCMRFPVAEKLCKEVLSIPVHPALKKHERKKVMETINRWATENPWKPTATSQ